MINFLKYFSIFICTIYSHSKILNCTYTIKTRTYSLIFCILLPIVCIFVKSHSPFMVTFIILFISFILFNITHKTNLETTITSTIISYAVSYITYNISALLVTFIIVFTIPQSSYSPQNLYVHVIVLITQLFTTHLLFIPKRVKNGMPFLTSKLNNTSIMFISILLLLFFLILNNSIDNMPLFICFYFIIIFSILFFFISWRNTITRTYRDKLRDRDLDLLNKHLDELEAEHKKVTEDKDELAKIVHRDNKFIGYTLQSVEDFLTNFPDATPQMKARGAEIVTNLSKEVEDRKGILLQQDKKCAAKLLEIGVPALDDQLKYMQKKAMAKNIHLSATADLGVADKIATTIDNKDLNTLVADLLENAIIASSYNQGTHVHFVIGYFGKHLVIHVHDSGIPFPKEVLLDLGITKHTTHADDGGSGIGLIEIIKFVRKYRASYIIDEYATPLGPYTKRISIVFDKRSRFTLNTSRPKEEINFLRQRADLTINVNKESVAK